MHSVYTQTKQATTGFPRKMDQAEFFESKICPPSLAIFLDCPQETLQERLINRAQTYSRLDDGTEIMQKRFKTFVETTMPVVQHYMAQNRVFRIDASHEVSAVYQEMQTALEKGLGIVFQRARKAT
jgi:UMP-CMP kinase